MQKSLKEDVIFKTELPMEFYLYRCIIVVAFIFLIVTGFDYHFILIAIIPVIILLVNTNNYVIKVYKNHFDIVLPSFFFNILSKKDTFYFEKIGNYKFIKGKFSTSNFITLEIIRGVTKNSFIGRQEDFNKYSIIQFDYENDGKIRTVTRKFSLSQTKQLMEANKNIEAKLSLAQKR